MRTSAGLLLFRDGAGGCDGAAGRQVLLVHPGGPFWARKDAGSWSVPKGEYVAGEDPFQVALREFTEELGIPVPESTGGAGDLDLDLDLGEVRQSAKVVRCWARRADVAESALEGVADRSNRVDIPWPPGSGRTLSVPEVDRAAWFGLDGDGTGPDHAATRILRTQRPFLDRLAARLG